MQVINMNTLLKNHNHSLSNYQKWKSKKSVLVVVKKL